MMALNDPAPGSNVQHYASSVLRKSQPQEQDLYLSSSFQPPPILGQSDNQIMDFQPQPLSKQYNQMYYDPLPNNGNFLTQKTPQFGNYRTVTSSAVPFDSTSYKADETLGRVSDDEFPEYVPGAWNEIRKQRVLTPGKPSMRFRTELDASDVKLVNELGQLSVDNLLDYMKNLQNNAFVLGEEEAKEFQKSKNLGFYKK